MKLFIMRHGQTDWNILDKIQGQKDIPLNLEGIQQAEKSIKKINKYNFDLIMCSPLKRARQTAQIISCNKIPIIYDNRLIERGLGDFEGTDSNLDENDLYNININLNLKNIETASELLNRINELMFDIKNKYYNKKILLLTHSGTARAIESYFFGLDNNGNMAPETLKNCEIREYKLVTNE